MFGFSAADLDLWLAGFFYPFARVAAMVMTAPILSDASMPQPVRAGLALLITIVVAPTLPQMPLTAPFSGPGIVLLLEQILIGAALGFAMQVAFAAITLAGDMIGLQMGLSFATFVDPEHSEPAPLIGSFLTVLLSLYFLSFNGHLQMIAALADSFRTLPIGANLRMDDVHALLAAASGIFAIGLRLALPVIAAILVANLTLGMLMRTAPQVNLLAIGFPLTLALGFAVLALMLPSIGPTFDVVIAQGLRALRP